MSELQRCEHCLQYAQIETMTHMSEAWFCQPCVENWKATFDACDHQWSPWVDEYGDQGQFCERCTGFVRNEDMADLAKPNGRAGRPPASASGATPLPEGEAERAVISLSAADRLERDRHRSALRPKAEGVTHGTNVTPEQRAEAAKKWSSLGETKADPLREAIRSVRADMRLLTQVASTRGGKVNIQSLEDFIRRIDAALEQSGGAK